MHQRLIASIALAGALLATATVVNAVTTQSFVLDSADAFFQGELQGTAVHSDGSVRAGAATDSVPLDNVPLAYSIARRGNATFVGTGTNGVVYRVEGRKVKAFAETGELLVSSLAFGRDGALYAGTLPEGRIYRIDPKSGRTARYSTPEGAQHIWALLYDKRRGKLVAGTGPEGKVFVIDDIGRAKQFFKAEASHIMSLATDGKGTLYAGTSDAGLVVRIDAQDKASVVHDFPGNEITALDLRDGELAVVSNTFKTAPGTQFKAAATRAPKAARPSARPRPGVGEVWRVDAGGRAEKLVTRKDTHFTAVQWGDDGAIFAGGGAEGRIFRVDPDATYSIWVDVDARQVLALDLRSSDAGFVTGDGAALHRVKSGAPKDAVWTSKALDATFGSTWGALTWRGSGRFAFQTRSGNTQTPGDTWSPWSKRLKAPGRIQSPPGRFIQVRALFPKDAKAELRAIELFYLPANQRARVSDVVGGRPPLKRGEPARQPPPPTTLVDVSWKVDNPDRDPLRYRLAYRRDGQPVWREMFGEDVVLTTTKHTWDTNSIPDGYYVVRVEASDEETNPDARTLKSSALSEPIRVDNHPPRIDELGMRRGRLRGRVVDSLGPISRIQVSVDAGPWRDVFPVDELLDSADERFDTSLAPLAEGPHIVAVRAFDAAGNQANREITVNTK